MYTEWKRKGVSARQGSSRGVPSRARGDSGAPANTSERALSLEWKRWYMSARSIRSKWRWCLSARRNASENAQ